MATKNYPDVLAVAESIEYRTRMDGGGTFNPRTGESVPLDSGYVVGGLQDTLVSPLTWGELQDNIATFIQRMPRSIVSLDYHHYLGTWVDDEGRCHIDASQVIENLGAAVSLAQERGEQAIWDVRNGNDIFVTVHNKGGG